MNEIIISKLLDYIRDNNPDLLFELEADDKLTGWLQEQAVAAETMLSQSGSKTEPGYIIIDECVNEVTKNLRPSRYNYILNVMEQEFATTYNQLSASGILQHEAINIIGHCSSVFDDLHFSEENEDNRFIYYAIAGSISEYLESNGVNENVSNELQQSAKATGQY